MNKAVFELNTHVNSVLDHFIRELESIIKVQDMDDKTEVLTCRNLHNLLLSDHKNALSNDLNIFESRIKIIQQSLNGPSSMKPNLDNAKQMEDVLGKMLKLFHVISIVLKYIESIRNKRKTTRGHQADKKYCLTLDLLTAPLKRLLNIIDNCNSILDKLYVTDRNSLRNTIITTGSRRKTSKIHHSKSDYSEKSKSTRSPSQSTKQIHIVSPDNKGKQIVKSSSTSTLKKRLPFNNPRPPSKEKPTINVNYKKRPGRNYPVSTKSNLRLTQSQSH